MINVVGVRFRGVGKISYFDPADLDLKAGTHVIAQTARGVEYGTVAAPPRMIEEEKAPQNLMNIIRIATFEDDEHMRDNRDREKEALRICREKIRNHGLEMKLIDAEYTFDNNKILFYFTADGRVDFRELVKDLAGVFRMRIELRQIGVRDETKLLGGMGICGRPLCCHTYLSDFAPVSIRMAKEQNLSLNPTKISGTCGRLMCCLKNEEETYKYLNARLPYMGERVTTMTGLQGEVTEVNVLRQKVKIVVEVDGEKEVQEYAVDELKFRGRKNAGKKQESETEKAGETAAEEAAPENRQEHHPRRRPDKNREKNSAGTAGEKKGSGARVQEDRPQEGKRSRSRAPRRVKNHGESDRQRENAVSVKETSGEGGKSNE